MQRCNFEVVDKGLIETRLEALVNAANEQLRAGSGVCGEIFKAAGRIQLQLACNSIAPCKVGNAVITKGFDLSSEYIIHAVGPKWHGGAEEDHTLMQDTYKHALELAKINKIHSIAFPLIGTGAFGWPVEEGARDAVQAINTFIAENTDYDLLILMAIPDYEKRNIFIRVMNENKNSAALIEKTDKKLILFKHENEEYGFLSMGFHLPFVIDGIRYTSSIQYLMAKKALMMDDMKNYILIMNETDPAVIRKLGRNVRSFDLEKWNAFNYKILYDANLAKFSQNPEYMYKLLKTGEAVLGQINEGDKIYSIGLNENDPDAENENNWPGKNMLGFTLMRIRYELGLSINSK